MSRLPQNYNYALPSLFLNLAKQIHDDPNSFTPSIRKYQPIGSWNRLIKGSGDPVVRVEGMNNISFVNLLSADDLTNEGEKLDICIGLDSKYRERALAGTHHYFSLRDSNGRSISTMELELATRVNPGATASTKIHGSNYHLSLLQHFAKNNSKVSPEVKKAEKLFLQYIAEGKIKVKTPGRDQLGIEISEKDISIFENATGTRFSDPESFYAVERLAWLRLALPEDVYWGNFGLDQQGQPILSASKDSNLGNTHQMLESRTRESRALGLLRRKGLDNTDARTTPNPIDQGITEMKPGGYYPVTSFPGVKSPHGVGNWSNDGGRKLYDNRAIPINHIGDYEEYKERVNIGIRFKSFSVDEAQQRFIRRPIPIFRRSLVNIAKYNLKRIMKVETLDKSLSL